MPKITVNETDLSWYYRQKTSGLLTVFMPGLAEFGPINKPTLVNADNFYSTFGTTPISSADISYRQAESFINSGVDVIFWRLYLPGLKVASVSPVFEEHVPLDTEKETEINPNLKYYTKNDDTFVEVKNPDFESLSSYYVNQLFTIEAKYPGEFGNRLSVKVIHGSNNNYRIIVYKGSAVLESLFVNFVDEDSSSYYKTVIKTSKYINVDTHVNVNDINVSTLQDAALNLTNGQNCTKEDDPIEKATEQVATSADIFEELTDKLSYQFNLIVDGGFNDASATSESQTNISSVDANMLALAKTRGDCIYLVDGKKTWDAEGFHSYISLPTEEAEGPNTETFNTSYAAAFGPWCSARYTSTGVTRILPGSYALIIGWAQSIAKGTPMYLAPAGVKRALLNFVSDTEYEVNKSVLDLWQNQDITTSNTPKINPIIFLKQYGYTIYGNSTLLKPLDDGSTSMLQSFSVRVLANMIKTQAFNVALSLQFDQASDSLFAQFKTLMTVFMDQLQYNGALYDYRIIADSATLDDLNSKTVPIKIQISPNAPADNFDITLEISQAGVSFGEDGTNAE